MLNLFEVHGCLLGFQNLKKALIFNPDLIKLLPIEGLSMTSPVMTIHILIIIMVLFKNTCKAPLNLKSIDCDNFTRFLLLRLYLF